MIKIYKRSVKDLSKKVEKGSVDVILTDPPYPKEYLHTYNEMARFAVHALKDGGQLLAMSSQTWLPDVFKQMDVEGLRYRWTISYGPLYPSGTVVGRRIFAVVWKPIIVYSKGKMGDNITAIRDVVKPDKKLDKRYHKWGQGEAGFIEILRALKLPDNALVCDPFLGGGTTAVCAEKLGYDFVGCDVDDECIKISKQRLKTIQQELL